MVPKPCSTGFTLLSSQAAKTSLVPNCVSPTDHATFKVRQVGYESNRVKGQSEPPYFDFAGADCFATPRKVRDLLSSTKLTDTAWCSPQPSDPILPGLVVHFCIPAYKPSMWSNSQDGPGWSLVFYYRLNAYGRSQLQELKTGPAQLIKNFWSLDAKAMEQQSVFKGIPKIENVQEMNLGVFMKNLVNKFNGTPFLTKGADSFIKTPEVLVANIDVHRFCYAARSGAYELRDVLSTLIIDFAIVLEGSGELLPEQLLGCCRSLYIDQNKIKSLEYYLGRRKHGYQKYRKTGENKTD